MCFFGKLCVSSTPETKNKEKNQIHTDISCLQTTSRTKNMVVGRENEQKKRREKEEER
jgi:hypothetical protein